MVRHVILGDGIAGSSAAETIRETDPDAEVIVITDEGEPLYNRILIKEYAKGKLPEAPISIHEPDWYEQRDIQLALDTHVTDIDTATRHLVTHRGDEIEYDRLLVATGGTPAHLPVDNADADGVHHFWTFEDARRIRAHAEEADRGVIIGAGLLGIDLAAICAEQGVEADYLMRGDCWWRYALSPTGGEIIHDALRDRGVSPVFGSGVNRFEVQNGEVVAAIDSNDERYPADFVGVAIGLDFNTEFLRGTDVELDDGVVVDEHMRTSVEGVYAAGDVTRFYDVLLDDRTQNGSWGSAKQQGAVAGKNMVAGEPVAEFQWVSSYSITHFDFPFLSFGHPTLGEDHGEARYSDTEWRRLAFRNERLVGGVLIGDLSPQSKYKQLIREERVVDGQADVLLEKRVDLDKLAAPQ